MTDKRCIKCCNMFRDHSTALNYTCPKCKSTAESGCVTNAIVPIEAADAGAGIIETIGDVAGSIGSVFEGL